MIKPFRLIYLLWFVLMCFSVPALLFYGAAVYALPSFRALISIWTIFWGGFVMGQEFWSDEDWQGKYFCKDAALLIVFALLRYVPYTIFRIFYSLEGIFALVLTIRFLLKVKREYMPRGWDDI